MLNPCMRIMASIALAGLLSGCELVPKFVKDAQQDQASNGIQLCMSEDNKVEFSEFCKLENWLIFTLETEQQEWSQRKSKIAVLGDNPRDLLIKILLSQYQDTPYQNRLRAQNWVLKLLPKVDPDMRELLKSIVYNNSQQLLEYESAITLISRVNVRQEKTIQDLQIQLQEREDRLQKQQDQVEQLLKIESDLIEQNRGSTR
ncbi:hypothetical protein [Glaciecola petra]|uniref:Uncharacterized protein n=1 Tax=Glaciecola petra TaxID=3075602 RepID=A0ABU2ZPU3_9ALTE|nr:hypothetical protein [Aestuariibacter sp. P117]MDT0594644.1 hypothetical protein [Aestuariibacter sp. P117]